MWGSHMMGYGALGSAWFALAAFDGCAVAHAQETTQTAEIALEEETSFSLSEPSYLLSSEELFGDTELLWPGFLTGMRATTNFHKKFAESVGNPFYFESPFFESQLTFQCPSHDFLPDSQLGRAGISAVRINGNLIYSKHHTGRSSKRDELLGKLAPGQRYARVGREEPAPPQGRPHLGPTAHHGASVRSQLY